MNTRRSGIGPPVACFLIAALQAGSGLAQNAINGFTPPAIAAGTPDGSYALSGLDAVGLYSGKVNFVLPIRAIGGRGKAGYTTSLPIQRSWLINTLPPDLNGYVAQYPHTAELPGQQYWFNEVVEPYSAGFMAGRQAWTGWTSTMSCGQTIPQSASTLTRFTFIAPDGSETEFVDQITGGKAMLATSTICPSQTQNGPARGIEFVATDGSAATFITAAPVYDYLFAGSEYHARAQGSIFFADGTRYDIGPTGFVSAIYDAMGNTVSVGASITDPLQRTTTVTYADITVTPVQDTIQFPGAGGASRTVTASYSHMDAAMVGAMASGQPSGQTTPAQATQDFSCLFPELNGSGVFDPWVVSSVLLPNGQTYSFKYNSYGEVAQVKLPTGGVIEYDYPTWTGACPVVSGVSGADDVSPGATRILRRLAERRVRPDGITLEQTTAYNYSVASGNTIVNVKHYDGSQNIISQEKHYFYGDATAPPDTGPWNYAHWQDSKEYQTDDLDATGNVLKSVSNTWQQHSCQSNPNQTSIPWFATDVACWFGDPTLIGSPVHYPAITGTTVTLEDSTPHQLATTTFGYDAYNNQTSVVEYGFDGSPLRQTTTQFLANGYDSIGVADANYGVVAKTVHIRRAPIDKKILDGQGNLAAETRYSYDDVAAVLLTRRDGGFAVLQVDRRVGGVRKRGDAHPGDELARGGGVGLNLVIELLRAGRVGCEDNVVTARTGDVTAVACALEQRVGGVEQEREVRLVGVWHFGVVDGDRSGVRVPSLRTCIPRE